MNLFFDTYHKALLDFVMGVSFFFFENMAHPTRKVLKGKLGKHRWVRGYTVVAGTSCWDASQSITIGIAIHSDGYNRLLYMN